MQTSYKHNRFYKGLARLTTDRTLTGGPLPVGSGMCLFNCLCFQGQAALECSVRGLCCRVLGSVLVCFMCAHPFLALGWGTSNDGGLSLKILLKDIHKANSGRNPNQSNCTESKAILMWRNLRIKLEEAQTEQTKPQRAASLSLNENRQVTPCLVTGMKSSLSVYFSIFQEWPSYHRPQNHRGSLCVMNFPKFPSRPLEGDHQQWSQQVLTSCPGDSRGPYSRSAPVLGGRPNRLFMTPHLPCRDGTSNFLHSRLQRTRQRQREVADAKSSAMHWILAT